MHAGAANSLAPPAVAHVAGAAVVAARAGAAKGVVGDALQKGCVRAGRRAGEGTPAHAWQHRRRAPAPLPSGLGAGQRTLPQKPKASVGLALEQMPPPQQSAADVQPYLVSGMHCTQDEGNMLDTSPHPPPAPRAHNAPGGPRPQRPQAPPLPQRAHAPTRKYRRPGPPPWSTWRRRSSRRARCTRPW